MQKVMNVATSSLQSYKPVNNICQHVCAFHFYANDMSRQVCSLRISTAPLIRGQPQKCRHSLSELERSLVQMWV